jgi:hypothetical protein
MRFNLLIIIGFLGVMSPGAAAADQTCDRLLPMGLLEPAGGFTSGCARQFTLKLGASLGPDGNYILLDYPSCPQGPCAGLTADVQLQCAAASGYACCVSSGQHVLTLTGGNVGTLAAGLSQRIALDTDTRAGICYNSYIGNGARVANVPLAHFPGTLRSEMVIDRFATVFLVAPASGSAQSTTVTLEFLALGVTPARHASWGRIKLLYR